jgi:hypothetical protein
MFEGMEESGSEKLDEFIESEKDKFFAGVDCMCISGKPSLQVSEARLWLTHRQLLAGYQDSMLDIRSPWYQLLRDSSFRSRPRSALWCLWWNCPRAND